MKTIITILLLALSSFANRPTWVDSTKTSWHKYGKVFIKIHVTSPDLDQGMNSTFARFREEVASHFCEENDRCVYFNFTKEQSYWETYKDGDSLNHEIYRLYSIKDIYPR
jgi:hypothetical protein